ncbi:MAG TPA: hypothetical protein VGR30_08775 [Candidatus Binatia bacterium]|jgi:hypothetical protein|nr:hypothetical protein [Candidatus Binatia bacterium]
MSVGLKTPLPAGIPATDEEAERVLLERLETASSSSDFSQTLWQLVHFYKAKERKDLAVVLIQAVKDRVERDFSSEERIRLYTEGAESKSSDLWTTLEVLHHRHRTLILRTLWILYAISIPLVFYKSYFVDKESLIFSIVTSLLEAPLIIGIIAIMALAAILVFGRWNDVRARRL